MATASVTYSFVALTTAESAKVNYNFNELVSFLNNSVIHADGSVAFTAVPSGPASDPTTDNQLTRKAYVDALRTTRYAWFRGKTSNQTGIGAGVTAVTFDAGSGPTNDYFEDNGNGIRNKSGGTIWVWVLASLIWNDAITYSSGVTRGLGLTNNIALGGTYTIGGSSQVGYAAGQGASEIMQVFAFAGLADDDTVTLSVSHNDSVTHTVGTFTYLAMGLVGDV